MKNIHFVITLMFVLIFSLLTGCSNESDDEKKAIRVATKYKEMEYKVDDYTKLTFPESYQAKGDEIKPFMADEFYLSKMKSRDPGLPLQIAQVEQSNIKAQQIQIISAHDEENGVMSLNYELSLILTTELGTSKEIRITGTLTMIKDNEEWKVKYDKNHNLKDLTNLAYQK